MKVFIAGATSAFGSRILDRLVARGDDVVGLTRSHEKASGLRSKGATAIVGDVLDRVAMERILREVEPEGVFQMLNDLPKRGPARPSEIATTNELRTTGTRNLLGAAIASGAKRFVAESMIFGYGYGHRADRPVTEETPFLRDPEIEIVRPALEALVGLEEQLREANASGRIEAIALRMGLFYAPGIGSTEFMLKLIRRRMLPVFGEGDNVVSWIHLDDAADAAVLALDRGKPGEAYNIVDDRPVSMAELLTRMASAVGAKKPLRVPRSLSFLMGPYGRLALGSNLPVANAKAKRDLGWKLRYPTVAEGLPAVVRATSEAAPKTRV